MSTKNEETQIDPAESPGEINPPYMEDNYECQKPPYDAEEVETGDGMEVVNSTPPLMEERIRKIFRYGLGE